MANILIDGYNLMGVAHKDLEKARNDLIRRLRRYAEIKGHKITVVFDGWKDGQAAETRERMGRVNVIYSCLGEKADHVIKKMLSSAVKPWVVVSSDREIYKYAEKKAFASVGRDEFEAKLASALDALAEAGPEGNSEEEEDFDRTPSGKKGNPRKPSKKDRKKTEALKKL